jgi:hypothetical protein
MHSIALTFAFYRYMVVHPIEGAAKPEKDKKSKKKKDQDEDADDSGRCEYTCRDAAMCMPRSGPVHCCVILHESHRFTAKAATRSPWKKPRKRKEKMQTGTNRDKKKKLSKNHHHQ